MRAVQLRKDGGELCRALPFLNSFGGSSRLNGKLRIRVFAHSLVSDWNHGNAHFLRGLSRALVRLGHQVRSYEELGAWSLANLIRQEGATAIEAVDEFRRIYSQLAIHYSKT